MLGKTHKLGGCLAMILGYHFMSQKQLLSPDIHPFVQLLIMYPAASWGSTASDLDQNLQALPEKTPFSLLLHYLLHLGKCTHRSWKTHSIACTGGFCLLLQSLLNLLIVTDVLGLNAISITVIRLLLTGLTLGVASHLLLDSITMSGIYLIPGVHFRLVPKASIFGTGTIYEKIIQWILTASILCMLIYLFLQK